MIPTFEALFSFAQRSGMTLLLWSWQTLVLLVCVAAALKLFRVQTPSLRHHVWLLGLLLVSVLPFGPKLAQLLPAPVAQPSPNEWKGQTLRYVTEFPALVMMPEPLQPFVARVEAPRIQSLTKPRFSFGSMVFSIWLIGAGFTLVCLQRNHWRMRRVRQQSQPVTAADLGCAALLPETIPLRLSTALPSPVLSGLRRPVILLPHDLGEWTTAEERDAMIKHELAHVARRDQYTNLLLNVLNVIFYFHPLVHYACRQIRLEREFACDDCVVGTGADAATYAESILKAAERCLARPTLAALHQPAFFTSKQTLERRIEMILNQDRMRVLTQQWKYLLLPTVAITMLAWLLIPAQMAKPGMAQTPPNNSINDNKDSSELLNTALKSPDADARLQAATWLAEKEDFMSKDALVALYNRSNEAAIKELVIGTYLKHSDIRHLAIIARDDAAPRYQELAQQAIKTLKETSDNPEIRQFDINKAQDPRQSYDAPPLPPPPPPPAQSMMTVEANKPLSPLPGHTDDLSAFGVLRQLADAHIRRDTSVFERLLSDGYVGYGPSGESFNKAEELAEVRKLDYTVTKFEFDDLRVSGNEGLSVATFLGTVYYQANGQDATVQYRYTATMVRLNPGGPLRVVSIHMSRKA